MEICISEYNEKKIVVLLDNEMKIVKPVYDYLRFQQQKGRATNTLKAYGTDLCLFWTFLKKNGYIDMIDDGICAAAFVQHTNTRPSSTASITAHS